MTDHRWILHVGMQPRAVPADGLTDETRTDALGRAARWIAILALVLGSLGAEVAATSGYGSGDHPGAHQSAGYSRLGHLTARPWMY